MPIYNGSNVNSVLRSISGKTPMSAETATTEINYALANNKTEDIIWYTEVFSDRMLVNLLLLLIGKSTDTQTVFGHGSKLTAGEMNTNGLFWGTNMTNSGIKIFGVENWWGNNYKRIAGWINDKGTQKIKMTYGQSDGSTVDGYNIDGSGYITIDCTLSGTSGGYVSKMAFNKNGLIPTIVNGSATTYYTDALWFSKSSVCYALVSGTSSTIDASKGAFCANLYNAPSFARTAVSASVSCKPLATQ